MTLLRRFLAALHSLLRPPIRPDGHDWPDWHHYTGEDKR